MVACGTVLTSCSDVLSEEGLGTCDDRAPVRLTISFGESSPMSRDVDAGSDGTVPELDPTTDLQKAMDADDVYLLVFDAQTGLLEYQVKDLSLSNPAGDDYNTRTLSGTMLATGTGKTVKLVVLANLSQNNITVTLKNSTSLALNNKTNVQAFIDDMIGEDQTTIYEKLIYNYNVTNNGTEGIWDISNRRIPMWGITVATQVPSTGTTLDCYLYRAVAKVQIWVNMKKGIQSDYGDFIINKIIVNNANDKGYCVHVANEQPGSDIDVQYKTPKVPSSVETQKIVYNVANTDSNNDGFNDAREAFSDMIYLPEQDIEEQGLTITIEYKFAGKFDSGTITFEEDVIRNHSYIFNINKNVNGEIVVNYCVTDWEEKNIDVPSFN